jgi:hypothetical protein
MKTAKEWAKAHARLVEEFVKYWESQSGDPTYPEDLEFPEWEDQFEAWKDMR